MKKKKKPNYALRRAIAKFILIMLILFPIIIMNKVKIINMSLYINNFEYSKVIDALFEVKYSKNQAKNLLNDLKKKKLINDNTHNYILKLNSKGYNKNTINFVLKNMTSKEITSMLSKDYNKDFEEYITLDLFDYKKYKRYLEYQELNENLSLDEIVTRIELNLDKDYYEDVVEVKNPDSITCLVNKYRYLKEDYEPSDLVDMSDDYANNRDNQKRIRKEVYDWFKKMVDDAKKVGIYFYAESAYRTYNYQETIYNSYLNANGIKYTDSIAARPGHSEHQTGLSLDLANIWTLKEGMDEYEWVKKNAYKYGFIIRYEPKKEDITGFGAESWHIRYVGKKAAKFIKENNITFDEYYVKYIKD